MVSSHIARDRGHAQAGNDKTLETRAKRFTEWLESLHIDDQSLVTWDPETGASMICTFTALKSETPKVKHRGKTVPVSALTLAGYAGAAAD